MVAMYLCLTLSVAVGGGAADDAVPAVADAAALLQQQKFAEAAAMLERIVEADPENARAWMLLGTSHHQQGDFEAALPAHLRAATFEATAPRALYNAACANAQLGRRDDAFRYLEQAKATGKIDLTGIALDTDLESLAGDRRLKKLLPSRREFKRPFVERTRILQEWRGEGPGDQFGWIAREIGDVDGDGVRDVTTSAPSAAAGGENAGRVYTYSGRSGKLLWTAIGSPGGQLGLGIEAAGDVDADGVPDVIAGEPGSDLAYVYAGDSGRVIRTLRASQEGEFFGRKVSDVGDVDGDGHDDVLVGAPRNDHAGEDAGRAAVYSGKTGGLMVEWFGERAGDNYGSAAHGVATDRGKLIVVGAPNAGNGEARGGRVYAYRGTSAAPAFVVESDETGSALGGMFVSVVGDVDADGHTDVYASDWSNNALGRSTGRIYVHSGRTGERLLTLTGETAGDGFGIGPADAGDVNGDGHDDLIIGAWQHGSAAPSGGKVYLFSGRDGELLQAWTGKVPGETFGFDATGMGDVNGDGAIDFLLTSAWSAVRGARTGRMYIVAGSSGLSD
jgi:hypothetical protein